MSTTNFSFSGSIPEKYDRYLGPYIFEPYAIYITERIKNSPGKVLEIACGTGRVTMHIAKKIGRHAKLIATDINPDMLEIAKQRVDAKNVQWQVADAQQLSFDDNSFDCIVCQFGYMFLPDKQKGFNEAWRVLKPGGQFLFNTWDKVENNITAYISRQIITEFFKDNPPEFYKIPFSMYDPEEMRTYLGNAGFKKMRIERITLPGESSSAIDIANGFVEGNPIITEIQKQDASQVESIKQKVAETIRKKFGDHPVRSELNAWVCEAEK